MEAAGRYGAVVAPLQFQLAAAGPAQPSQQAQQAGLAGAVGTDEAEQLAAWQQQLHIAQDAPPLALPAQRAPTQQGWGLSKAGAHGANLRRSRKISHRKKGPPSA